ncbi:MAG: hypothetical protein IJ833_08880 [Lachnospiraceae bacterium]|nr:hypothetical protein [Lachnospiraceae bacterium]
MQTKDQKEKKQRVSFFRVPFYLLGMLLTAPGKCLHYFSGKLKTREDLEKVENVCGLLIGIAIFNLLRAWIYRIWLRAIIAIFVAFILIEVFDYIVFSADSVRKALQFYTHPFAKRYDYYLSNIERAFGKRQRTKKQENTRTGKKSDTQNTQQKNTQRKNAQQKNTQQKKASRQSTQQQGAGWQDGSAQTGRRKKELTPLEEAKSIFSVEEPYGIEEIRSKRNLLLKTYHPDNHNGSEEMCKKINECYDLLLEHIS